MNLRATVLSFGLMAVIGAISASSACDSKNECEKAADRLAARYDECGGETVETGDTGDTGEGECTEAAGKAASCLADCSEAADCKVVTGKGPTDPNDPEFQAYLDAVTKYGECTTKC